MSWLLFLLFLVLMGGSTLTAEAAEYRLQVVSLYESAFAYYLDPNGSKVPLSRLESALDRGTIPKGVVLYDRWVQPAEPSVARAFGAPAVKAELIADRPAFLPEYRWQGEPGALAVWTVQAQGGEYQALTRLGLKGAGAFRHVLPERVAFGAQRSMALGFSSHFLDSWDGRTGLWEQWLLPRLDLTERIAAVVGVYVEANRPDRVYLVIQQPAAPERFKAVLAWRKRMHPELEGPGTPDPPR